MAIEKLYLTDTFRVWAEKFNATIQASNTATANAEEAINKANEAINKAEEAIEKTESVAPKKHDSPNDIYGLGSNLNYGHMRGDGITTNGVDGEVIVKDVAIGGNPEDLASTRGVFNAYPLGENVDFDTVLNQGIYAISNVGAKNGPGYACRLVVLQAPGSSYSNQIAFGSNPERITIRSKLSNGSFTNWVKFISETNLATTSAPGITQPDNTTITVKNGVISAKAMETITDITVFNNDFNNLTDSGVYFIQTTQGITQNSPIDITAYWWVKVTTDIDSDDSENKNILQEVRLHSTDSGGAAYSLARCMGTIWGPGPQIAIWGPWEYAYTQFAG